jgi:hypothetical protein
VSADNERHFALLRSLAEAGVGFVTIGSAGLLLAHPRLRAAYALTDCDVLLADGALRGFVAWAEGRGGTVTCWGEPWDARWTERSLAGRWYVRAVCEALVVDATFEEADFDVGALLREARWIDGVPVCPERELWAGKLRKDADGARRFAAEYGLTIPLPQRH